MDPLDAHITALRNEGLTFSAIGLQLGITKDAAQKRYARAVNPRRPVGLDAADRAGREPAAGVPDVPADAGPDRYSGDRGGTETAELRASLTRTLRALDKAKATRDELVAAVYEAASDAIHALDIPPVPTPRADRRPGAEEVAVVVIGDWQLGKRTPSYNSDVCAERIERLAAKVSRIVDIQRADHPVRECHVLALGDLVEGELIFGGQAHRIDASLYRQVAVDGPRIYTGLLRSLAATFEGGVTAWEVDGNHGAIAGPFRKEMHPESNADRMLYQIAALLTEADPRIRHRMLDPEGERNWYHVAEIGAYRSLLVHGDQFRGTAGLPWYGVQKKTGGWALGAIEGFATAFGAGGDVDLDFGHWHQPTRMTLNRVTARCNGSTESHNTYAQEQLGSVGRPSQALRFVDPAKGRVTAEYCLYLD